MPTTQKLPALEKLHVLFAHPAYGFEAEVGRRQPKFSFEQARSPAELEARVAEADIVVVSGFWRNELLVKAPRLRYVQSISAGTNQYDFDQFRKHGVKLASAQGLNANAVAEHATGLMLALARHIHLGRDNQANKHWRGMIADAARREEESQGKTILIVGLGGIGERLAVIAKALGMRVIATRRRPGASPTVADKVVADTALLDVLPEADVVALTCPLTPETEGLIGAKAFARMKPTAHLINVARGKVVDEAALVAALSAGQIAAAGLDVTTEEPLPAASPLWSMPNVLITPHSAGETQAYEARIVDIMLENMQRLHRGESLLRNEVA